MKLPQPTTILTSPFHFTGGAACGTGAGGE
jgi:hypothetical protein